ncbi:MAG TPA: hydantoinase/oxoprolinase family protein [Alphaproteobacteria bacterium]|nr:hydantoinase/oxoprolinase family protein [Alphaproteobacteria bacterium]
MSGARRKKYVVASDVGGTCTDTIVFAEGEPVRIGKALSTPPNFAEGVLNSARNAAEAMGMTLEALFAETYLFVHGSTVVDNTVLTRDGSRTGLLTTAGFEDTLLVTRGAYGRWAGLPEDRIKHPVATDRAPALVSADLIQGVPERVDYKGAVLRDIDEAATEKALRHLIETKKAEAIAVCFLWSFYNPVHEKRVRQMVERIAPQVFVTLSSEISPVPGEYERTSTTVINAYAGRITRDYLTHLEELLAGVGYKGAIMVMQGYGGLLPATEAADRAVGMIECGPAAGVIGAKFLGDLMGDKDVIAADMGGTTFKVGVIQDGQIEYAREPMVDRFHYLAPKIEVVSIGSGGGSIISLDPKTKVPRVGPQSAGARPGPVCYGQGGTEPTLTDVMLLIGYMHPDTFLGGSLTLDAEAARRVFKAKIADPLGRSVEEAAFGIYRVAAAQITDLIHEITVERGLDPRDFVLHAFGGTCGLLAGVFGQELKVRRIVVPYTASVNCAFGLVSADIVHEYSVTKTLPVPTPAAEINALYQPMIERAKKELRAEGFADDKIRMDWSVDLRYSRQVHEVTTPVHAARPLDDAGMERLVADFEALYERKYGKGSAYREAGMEMTMFRLSARGLMTRPRIEKEALKGAGAGRARMGERPIFVDARNGMVKAGIFDFNKLEPGNVVPGPAVIHTPITTIVVQDRQTGRMDAYRNVVIEFA